MTIIANDDVQSLKQENDKLRHYINLVSFEMEFIQRISEINSNFANPDDVEHLTTPIKDRLSKIKNERNLLAKELNIDSP